MSTAPIDRDTQIALIKSHKQRRKDVFARVCGDTKVKQVLATNKASGTSSYARHDDRIAKLA